MPIVNADLVLTSWPTLELTHPGYEGSAGGVSPLDRDERGGEEPGALLLSESVALAVDVEDVALVKQSVQDGGDDRITEDLAPVRNVLVRSQG